MEEKERRRRRGRRRGRNDIFSPSFEFVRMLKL
jgi:hypothetical protein